MFPVFDPITEEFLYFKDRNRVHIDGDWHRGVQANIIRKNKRGTFDILVQKRSNAVDIGKQKYDQSLATQMIDTDGFNELTTLQRGLTEELSISSFKAKKVKTNIRIIKTYEEQHEKLNRELLSLYIVVLENPKELSINSPKVSSLEWMEWHTFLKFFQMNITHFTKTGRFYFETDEICNRIENVSYDLLFKDRDDSSKRSISGKIFFHISTKHGYRKTYKYTHKKKESMETHFEEYAQQ